MEDLLSKMAALALLGISVLGTAFAFPFFGNGVYAEDKDLMSVRENIFSALENQDFSAWKRSIETELTEERFNQMVERHKNRAQAREIRQELRVAKQSGDTEKMKTLGTELEELGFSVSGRMQGKGRQSSGKRGCSFS